MSDIRISKVVIHELVKTQHQPIQPSNLRNEVLGVDLDPVNKLVAGVASLYGKRNNMAHYGTFRNGEGRGNFPDAFESYAKIPTPTDQVFIDLSLEAMGALFLKAENIHAASGGYLLFADYSNAQGRFFIIAMIKQKEGMRLSRQLVPEELTQLDLDRLYQAARINFGKLSAYQTATESDRQEQNYLSFVSPSNSKTAAGYFVTALGCAQGTASARATDTIIRESVGFFRQHDELSRYRQAFKNDLLDLLTRKEREGSSVKLSEIEGLARRYIPSDEPGRADEIADDLIAHLNDEENAVPVEFPVSKAMLVRHRQIRYKANNWDIAFERTALGEGDDAQVQYDRDRNRIILNSVPSGLVDMIREEIENQTTR